MKKGKNKVINALLLAGLLILLLAGANSTVYAQEESFFLPELQPSLSVDGLTLYNGVPPLVVIVDPNPYMQGIKAPGPTAADALAAPEAAVSTFSITYVAAGGKDPWDAECVAFPAEGKTAFNAAAAIWANKVKSTVPIKIRACWSDLGSEYILGYSGGQLSYRNFTHAPKTDVMYQSSLANSIAGSDLGPADFDMNITYNKYFDWYFGTDGNPPAGQYDLVSVAAHEMAHGLNFSGTVQYSGGTGSYGRGTPYPNIYDTFMENGAGKALTTFANPSTALGSLLTSNDLWFKGSNATAGNGGTKVKMYAPSSWSSGSSYSHLDYNTFRGTTNSMMVYAVAAGASNHDPGPVTSGLLKDLGWQFAGVGTSTVPTPQSPTGNITDKTPTYKWTKVSGATQYRYQLVKGSTTIYTKTVASSACGSSTCSNTPTTALAAASYKWKVQAKVGGVWKAYSAFLAFTVAGATTSPKAGFWESEYGDEFYVTTDQKNVDNFAIILDVDGCGIITITHPALVPIVNKKFSFSGTFYGEGTFDSATSAHGTDGLNNYYSNTCGGYLYDIEWNWTATWKDSSQPTIVVEGGATAVIDKQESQGPSHRAFIVEP